jgi:four helix bundle protein
MAFSFEKLLVYQKALDWVDRCDDLVENSSYKLTLPQRDQLSRAAMSIALNIAEANGRWHRAEKRNFFWIARGSVFECAALLQILERRKKISKEEYLKLFIPLEEIGKMLTGLVKSVEGLATTLSNPSSGTSSKLQSD